jgi:myo-inositol 2-dehydrogenase/D-chiro-inositol 1-dehydrogenase
LREWEAFAAMVRDRTPSPVPAEAGRAPLVIGLAALKSVREGRPVRISEITGS